MDTKNKSRGWLKGKRTNQNQLDKNSEEASASTHEIEDVNNGVEASDSTDVPKDKNPFSKDNQDKISLDMIISVENMLKDRQLILHKNKSLEDQLHAANETIDRLKDEQEKKDQLLQEKDKEISEIENKLTKKQMNYDQLLEDYKEYQNTSKSEFHQLTNQLEKENHRYNKLSQESANIQHQQIQKISQMEEKIRNLEVENQNYLDQYVKIQNEKNQLMKTINDFTERMTFSLSSNSAGPSSHNE